jgi:uncharacterized membrane protein
MRSKAAIQGHPIHPMLIAFPVALYVVTFVGYVVYSANGDGFWLRLGYYANIGAVATAVLAAVPGLIDWLKAIPARTHAKRDGLVHMLLNVTALALFAVAAVLLGARIGEAAGADEATAGAAALGASVDASINVAAPLVLTGLGVLLTLGAGWLGWRLVQTHHVGVILTPEQERLEPGPEPHEPRRERPTYRPGLPGEEADAWR